MSEIAPNQPPQRKSYFELKPEEVPLFKLRHLIGHWLLPFNNLYLLCQTLGINAAVAGTVDLLTPKLRLFPWMTAGALALTVACVLLQSGWRPAWTIRAKGSKVGRFFLSQTMGSFSFLLLLLSIAGSVWAEAHPQSRGVLATQSATLLSVQNAILGLREDVAAVKAGVDSANVKLDRLAAAQLASESEAANRQARAATRPESLGVLSLTLMPATTTESYQLFLATYITAPGLSLNHARLQMRTRGTPDSAWTIRDLTDRLTGAADQQTLQIEVAKNVREMQLCLGADYPNASQPHAVVATYRFDPTLGDQALQPQGAPSLVATGAHPCGI